MNIIDEGIETHQLFEFLRQKQVTDAQLRELIQLAERVVHEYHPHAKVLFTSDKHNRITHAGIYDFPLLLNERGQFKPIQQYAPQLLSKKVEYKETHHTALKLKIQVDIWLDALLVTAKKWPELALCLRSNQQHGTFLQ